MPPWLAALVADIEKIAAAAPAATGSCAAFFPYSFSTSRHAVAFKPSVVFIVVGRGEEGEGEVAVSKTNKYIRSSLEAFSWRNRQNYGCYCSKHVLLSYYRKGFDN
jgi:hypothetical protein